MENPQRIKNIVELKNYKKDDLLKNLFNKIIKKKLEKQNIKRKNTTNILRMNILRNLKNKYSLNTPEDVKKIVELLSKLRT